MTTPAKRRTLGHDPEALVWAREQRGLSQTELARRAKVPQGNLSQIEAGKRNTTPEVLRRLADALRWPLSFLEARPAPIATRAPPSS